ncbi:hypothetical protein FHR33_009355 [Nonomuraea dietziae]|uniref:Uncharacterized protein n=1 Tax=Nonomuraea dietziae TaxID=65515 RepID=A0A7W5VJY1_9ACTN|nr:hypothetical protein [Nonomuraea dietziae]
MYRPAEGISLYGRRCYGHRGHPVAVRLSRSSSATPALAVTSHRPPLARLRPGRPRAAPEWSEHPALRWDCRVSSRGSAVRHPDTGSRFCGLVARMPPDPAAALRWDFRTTARGSAVRSLAFPPPPAPALGRAPRAPPCGSAVRSPACPAPRRFRPGPGSRLSGETAEHRSRSYGDIAPALAPAGASSSRTCRPRLPPRGRPRTSPADGRGSGRLHRSPSRAPHSRWM